MVTICLFDLLYALVRTTNSKLRIASLRRVLVTLTTVGVLSIVVYWRLSVDYVLLELNMQASPSGLGVAKMFGSSRNRVCSTYEHHLPQADHLTALDGVWQNVSGTSKKFFVYSAYYERRRALQRSIRVIGATRTYDSDAVWCRLWYHTEPPQSISVLAHIKIIHENWKLPYSACFVLCPLQPDVLVPQSVSIVRQLHSAPTNRLSVIDNFQANKNSQGRLAVCIQPIHNYNKTLNLVEFLELYSLLGADRVTLYDANTDPAVDCVLRDYVTAGLVTYMPWGLELTRHDGQIWVHGIHAALNDCLYRNMYRYANIAIVDLDEFIVPRQADTLVELIKYLDTNPVIKRPVGSYNFRNVFFLVHDSDNSSVPRDTLESKLLTISKTTRYRYANPTWERSKYVCKPELTVETGNHFVWKFLPDVEPYEVDPGMALSHHYRTYGDGTVENYLDIDTVTDRTAHKFKGRLTRRVREKWAELRVKCGSPVLWSVSVTNKRKGLGRPKI